MPTPTYTPLANITLGASAASVTFSSISQAYRDLVLVATATTTSGGASFLMRFNGDSASNYSYVRMLGNGSTTNSGAGTSTSINAEVSVNIAGPIDSFIYNIMDYSATDKHKSVLLRANDTGEGVVAMAHRWANTAAISSIVCSTSADTFAAGSTFSLYGISA